MNMQFMLRTLIACVRGIPTTLMIVALTMLISSPIAVLVGVLRYKKVRVVNQILGVYTSFIRGTPSILQIYLVYNTVPSLLALFLNKIGSSINVFELNPIIYALVVFVLNITATFSEIVRSALMTVDKGQYEAAQTVGLSKIQTYVRIIFPQAVVSAIPNICTLVVGLIKMTSLAFAMTVQDIMAIAKIEAGNSYNYIEAYIDVFVLYLIFCILVETVFRKLEANTKRFKLRVSG